MHLKGSKLGGVIGVFCLLFASCNRTPQYVDDFARAFRLEAGEAERVLATSARQADLPEEQIARTAINDADLIAPRQSAFASILEGIDTRVRRVDIDEVVEKTFCAEFLETLQEGPPTEDEVYDSLINSVGTSYANAILNTGQINRFVNVMNTLESGDSGDISLLVAQALYC